MYSPRNAPYTHTHTCLYVCICGERHNKRAEPIIILSKWDSNRYQYVSFGRIFILSTHTYIHSRKSINVLFFVEIEYYCCCHSLSSLHPQREREFLFDQRIRTYIFSKKYNSRPIFVLCEFTIVTILWKKAAETCRYMHTHTHLYTQINWAHKTTTREFSLTEYWLLSWEPYTWIERMSRISQPLVWNQATHIAVSLCFARARECVCVIFHSVCVCVYT